MQNPKPVPDRSGRNWSGSLSSITKELLAAYNLHPKKRLGQNFLIDPDVLDRILKAAKLNQNDYVVELGMGLGVLTEELAKKAKKVISLEVDTDLILICKKILKNYFNVEIAKKSILEWSPPEELNCFKVAGNLPYYITAPIIEKILDGWRGKVSRAVLTVQKEVAERLTALPGGKTYGSFSVFVQNQARAEIASLISKYSFYPKPDVSSAIIVLEPYNKPLYNIDYKIVRDAFSKRRKTIRNSLSSYNIDWEKLRIDPKRRAETLSLEEFETISKKAS